MTQNDSTAIKICRLLCIFFMTYVHVNPGKDSWIGEVPGYLSQIAYILSDTLGRASTPALSILGGYLAVSAYSRRSNWWMYAKDRWQTLMTPMIAWNLVIILLSICIYLVTGVQDSELKTFPSFEQLTPLLIADRLTGYDYGSATIALNFLRDLFMCYLLLPLILHLFKRTGVVGVGIIWLVGLTVGYSIIVLRPNILMFFVVGIYLALQSDQLIPARSTLFKLLSVLFITSAIVYLVPALAADYSNNVTKTTFRMLVACIFLIASIVLSRVSLGKLIARLEPYAYLMFLSHMTIMLIFWGVWQKLFGNNLMWPYVVFFVLAPFATLVAVIGLHKVLEKTPAPFQKIFSGKTIRQANKKPSVKQDLLKRAPKF